MRIWKWTEKKEINNEGNNIKQRKKNMKELINHVKECNKKSRGRMRSERINERDYKQNKLRKIWNMKELRMNEKKESTKEKSFFK